MNILTGYYNTSICAFYQQISSTHGHLLSTSMKKDTLLLRGT